MFYSSNIIFAVCFIFILMKVCIQKTKQRYCCRLDFYSFTKKVLYHRYFPDDFVEAFRGTLSDCFSLFIIKNMFTRLTKQTNTYQANAGSAKNLVDWSIRSLTQIDESLSSIEKLYFRKCTCPYSKDQLLWNFTGKHAWLKRIFSNFSNSKLQTLVRKLC